MELPITILLVCIILMQVITCWSVIAIEKWLAILTNIEPEKTDEPAKVTDPFSKPAEVYSSTSHIIVPKTPTEIRNQNFKRIQNGEEYGNPFKR